MNAKIERQFVDTNILIHAHDLSAGRTSIASLCASLHKFVGILRAFKL